MADSKHTITIKSEDSGKGRGSEDKLNPADFMKLFQQEVAKIKDAILKDNPDMPRGEAQRQAQKEASEQLQTSRRRNEGTVAPSSTDDGDDLKLAPPVDINPRTILPDDPIEFEEDSDEDIVKSQNVLRGMSSGKSDPTKPLSLEADEGNFDDSNDQYTHVGIGGNKEEEEDFYNNLIDEEQERENTNRSIRSSFGLDNDEGNFDDADDQLQDDVEESSEDSDTDQADAATQMVKATVGKEDKYARQKGKNEQALGDIGEAVGSTFFGEAGGVVGREAGERIGKTVDFISPAEQAKRLGRGIETASDVAMDVAGTPTGDFGGAVQSTANAAGEAISGAGELAADFFDAIQLGPLGDAVMMVTGTFGKLIEMGGKLVSVIDQASEEVAGFNPQILGERIDTDLDMLFKKMDRAQKVGDEFAEFEAAKGDTMSVFEDIKTVLLKVMTPIATALLKVATYLLETLLGWMPEIIEFFAMMLEALAMIVDWFDGSGDVLSNRIEEAAGWLRKTAKEVEQWHDEEKDKEQNDYMGEIDRWLTGGFLENDHIGAIGPAPPGVL